MRIRGGAPAAPPWRGRRRPRTARSPGLASARAWRLGGSARRHWPEAASHCAGPRRRAADCPAPNRAAVGGSASQTARRRRSRRRRRRRAWRAAHAEAGRRQPPRSSRSRRRRRAAAIDDARPRAAAARPQRASRLRRALGSSARRRRTAGATSVAQVLEDAASQRGREAPSGRVAAYSLRRPWKAVTNCGARERPVDGGELREERSVHRSSRRRGGAGAASKTTIGRMADVARAARAGATARGAPPDPSEIAAAVEEPDGGPRAGPRRAEDEEGRAAGRQSRSGRRRGRAGESVPRW